MRMSSGRAAASGGGPASAGAAFGSTGTGAAFGSTGTVAAFGNTGTGGAGGRVFLATGACGGTGVANCLPNLFNRHPSPTLASKI